MPNLEDIIKTYGAIPDITKFKRPMFVGPHQDDIEFGCGALLSLLKDTDSKPVYVVVTDGAAGTTDPGVTPKDLEFVRNDEQRASAKFLGVSEVEFLGLPDGGDYEVVDVIRALAPAILKYQPDAIFAPDPRLKTECHPDHLKVGEAVRRLTQLVPHPESLRRHKINVDGIENFPSDFCLCLYFTDEPNTAVPVSEKNLSDKIEALKLHKSQMASESIYLLLSYFQLKAASIGQKTNSPTGLAEDYQVIVPLAMHVFTEGIW